MCVPKLSLDKFILINQASTDPDVGNQSTIAADSDIAAPRDDAHDIPKPVPKKRSRKSQVQELIDADNDAVVVVKAEPACATIFCLLWLSCIFLPTPCL